MSNPASSDCHVKVFYYLIEAAILWAGKADQAQQILELTANLDGTQIIAKLEQRPNVQLCAARIWDALVHGELSFGRDGVTTDDQTLLADAALTIRHVDLKAWMSRRYPGERPEFLFDEIERSLHPGISLKTAQILMMEREALRFQLNTCVQVRERLDAQVQQLEQEQGERGRAATPGPRAEGTYLNIVGGLLDLLLGKSPSGVAYSSFETREAVVSALLAHHGGKPGISERTLRSKFSTATRHLNAQ